MESAHFATTTYAAKLGRYIAPSMSFRGAAAVTAYPPHRHAAL